MKNRILFIIPSLVIGGAEKVVLDLAEKMDEKGLEIGILSLSEETPFFSKLKYKDNIKLYTCGNKSFSFPFFSIKRWVLFTKAIKSFNPTIIHSHLWSIHCLYMLSLITKSKRIKIFHTVHATDSHYTNPKFIFRLFTFIEVLAIKILNAKVIAISDEVKKLCEQKLNFSNVKKISNGIDTSKYILSKGDKKELNIIGITEKSKVIINIGRVDKQKGQIYLIEAFNILIKEKYEDYHLLLVGLCLEEKVKARVDEYGLNDNVHFLGIRQDIPEIIGMCDIGVFPSIYEGFGLVCGEMMSCGLPTIISDIKSLLEISHFGNGAYITPVADSKAIADAIKELTSNEVLRNNLATNGRKIIKNNFSLEKQVKNHIDFYYE